MKVRTLFLSDIHLGYPLCQAEKLLRFLDNIEFERLILIGDVLDIWHMDWNRKFLFHPVHRRVIKRFVDINKTKCPVTYVYGNHDNHMRELEYRYFFGLQDLNFCEELSYKALNGKSYLVSHGDRHDLINYGRAHLLTRELGDFTNSLVLGFDKLQLGVRKSLGYPHWSLTNYLASKIRTRKLKSENMSFRQYFEKAVSKEAKARGFDGAICGHIHVPADKIIEGIHYLNDGDWVQSSSALVETYNGELKLFHFF